MYLLYLDASGAPELSDHTTAYCLAGLCAHESSWDGLESEILKLKRSYQHMGRQFELHATDFAVWIREQDEVHNFDALTWDERRSA